MRIGFFGDSFCSDVGANIDEPTYLKKLSNHYNAKIVHVGTGGSSAGDVLMKQLQVSPIPEICVFVWTDVARLFHNEVRNINYATVEELSPSPIHNAAKEYYKYLYDHYFATIQYKALLEYIDNHVLSTFADTTKIIHLWSFGDREPSYYYRWKHGVEINPPLFNVTITPVRPGEIIDPRFNGPNHLEGQERNELVFNWIKEAIDNYSNGALLTKEIKYE